jgi:hypothetical protein
MHRFRKLTQFIESFNRIKQKVMQYDVAEKMEGGFNILIGRVDSSEMIHKTEILPQF